MSELPKGWVSGGIRDLYEINPGHKGLQIAEDLPVSFVPMPSIEECTGRLDATHARPYREVRTGFTRFVEGDVVFAKITPCMENGKVALAEGLSNGVGAGTTELHVFRPRVPEANRYLLHFLLQESVREEARKHFQGTSGHLRVPVSFFDEVQFPIPPLAEQRRIVAKLEALLGTVDACRARFDRIPALLKRFRQSVLAAACSGRLTADWREGSVSDDEELPSGWGFGKLEEVLEGLKYGTAQKSEFDVKGYPVLRIPNIGDGVLDLADMKYASLGKEEYAQLKVKDGDLLMIRSNGSRSLVGKTAIVRKGEAGYAYAGYLIRLRIDPRKAHPEFINLALASQPVRDQIEIPLRSTSGVNNINSTEVRSLTVPCPPLAEQKEIIRRVEALFAVADQIEARYAKAKGYVDRLTQSILAKAFRGELLPQDPSDEPASVLLERIRGAKGEESPSSPGVRRGTGAVTGRAGATRGGPARKEAPTPSPNEVVPAAMSDVPLSRTARAILKRMKPGRNYGCADLAAPLGLSSTEWTAAVRELKEGEHILQAGERRGAKYRIVEHCIPIKSGIGQKGQST